MASLLIRVDATLVTGSGHLVRCLSLAQAMKRHYRSVTFFTRGCSAVFSGWITEYGFGHVQLSETDHGVGRYAHSHWLPCSELSDAEEFCNAVRDRYGDGASHTLIVDHYALGAPWEAYCRNVSKQILAIDDLADRPHTCDLLVDQNFDVSSAARYAALVPISKRVLTGPAYAILGDETLRVGALIRRSIPVLGSSGARSRKIRALLFFGGVDAENATGAVLDALLTHPRFPELDVTVLLGAANPNREDVLSIAKNSPLRILQAPVDFPGLLSQTDLCIGAGGTTTWERLYFGIPSLVLSIAANQVASAEALGMDQFQIYLGASTDSGWKNEFARGLDRVLSDPDWVMDLVERGRSLVDGNGKMRISTALREISK